MSLKDNYLTVQQSAEYLGIQKQRMKIWIKKKMVPAYKLGATILLKKEDLDNLIKPI